MGQLPAPIEGFGLPQKVFFPLFWQSQKYQKPKNSANQKEMEIFKKYSKQALAKPEVDATLFTACCILLMSTVDVES